MRPWNTEYMYMTPAELYNIYSNSSEKSNLLLVEAPSLWGRYYYSYRFGMNYTKYQEMLGENVTGGAWCFPIYTAGTYNYLIPKMNEFFVKESVNATIGQPYVMVPLFTTEEVLFNRAEANAYLGNSNDALADLNLYASKRIVNYDATTYGITVAGLRSYYGTSTNQDALVNGVIDFKRVEYIQEGMRWFDLMRYKVPVTHTTTAGETLTLGADDLHRVLQIPASAKTSGIALNPR
jgi:hypothetical protein